MNYLYKFLCTVNTCRCINTSISVQVSLNSSVFYNCCVFMAHLMQEGMLRNTVDTVQDTCIQSLLYRIVYNTFLQYYNYI